MEGPLTPSAPGPGTGRRPAHSSTPPGAVYWRRRTVLGALLAAPVLGAAWAAERWLEDGSPGRRPQRAAGGQAAGRTAERGGPKTQPRGTIAEENAKQGTDAWSVPQVQATWDKVRGFASRTSVETGDSFQLFVSTAAPSFRVTAFRMGYYQSKAGRQVWASGPIPGRQQPDAVVDPETNMSEARWEPSLTITTANPEWVPGPYLLKLESSDGGQSQVPLVVRDDRYPAPVHIQHDVTTWQAYNTWGGASLYEGERGRSQKVSFDRPYSLSGSGNFLGGCYEIGALVESLGLEVTYSTNVDTHAQPALVGDHNVWVGGAHDEYWSKEMRDGVTAARDKGVNLMFLGANCMYRRIRFEDSSLGPNRRVVNYRVASQDPLNGKDPERVTTSWREAPAARPESDITGTYYESNPVKGDMVIVAADAWMFTGTGVGNGDRWPDVIGNEYDRVTPEVPTPPTIQVLAHSPVVVKGHPTFSDMTYYTVPSGAGVFSAGSIYFERHVQPGGAGFNAQIVAMTTNIVRAFAAGPAGRAHPAQPNLAQLGIHPGYVAPVD